MESSSTIEDDDRLALNALLSNSGPLPYRNAANIHSHSQQLRAPKRRHHQHPRNHSLDNIPNPSDAPSDDDDDDDPGFFHSYSSSSTPSAAGDDFPISQSIPEFIGSGGGTGAFRLPKRGVIHPTRPPCLELRPHPLRETQVGKFLRTIACTDTQLWAGQENGVRFWRFQDAYEPGLGGKVRRGEEDAAPFHESSNTPPTMCLLVDCGTRLVWSGHKDGKIRSWKMDPSSPDVAVHAHFKEGLSWQAHPRPVISMVISSYGDLWSGGEGGLIRIWPWETIEKSLSLRAEEKHMAGLLVERSFIDLRSQVSSNGNNSLSSSEIKCLYSDHVQGRIWIAQPLFFSLWDARTKELLKVFNIDGQLETRIETQTQTQTQTPSTNNDSQVEEGETNSTSSSNPKTKSSSSKKEKSGFLQRSRNALMGAADAVRRVAGRGSNSVDDSSKRTEALVATPDGMVWSGCTNGALILWDGNGNRLHDVTHHPCGVQCFCVFGARIYIGYVSGMMQVMDLEGNIVAAWMAHDGPVIKVAAGNGFIFSLASHGGIRAWNVASPSPLDGILRTQLAEQEAVYSRRGNLKLLIGTWNVGQGRATQEALMCWLSSVSSDVGIVVVGLQEVEMGAGFLAMSAAKESVGLDGSSVGNWWLDAIGKALDENMTFERMGSRQLAGLLIGLWVRKNLRTHVGDVDAGAVPCGFGRAIGNKGGVGLRIRVLDRLICFVNCHLAAHLEAVNRRNADFDHIFRNMAFSRSLNQLNNVAANVSISGQMLRSPNQQGANPDPEESKTDLADADMVIFFGDFNYRLFGISYDEARDLVSQRSFDWLREKDQLRAEMKAGKVFHGMREAIITFPPTYKFERGRPGLGGYDAGEKKRIPAWCDRVIYRDNRSGPVSDCSLECPIISSITMYEACMDVTESDHKPVRCKFHIRIAHVERSSRRQAFGEILKSDKRIRSILHELRYVPETVISTSQIVLQNQDTAVLRVTNKCSKSDAIFKIICQGQSTAKEDGEGVNEYHARGSFGFPRWLEVNPAAGIIKPEQSIEVQVHHEEFQSMEDLVDGIPQNWWCEDARDRQVILNVLIRGYTSTETKTHVVQVHHTISPRGVRTNSKSNSNKNLSDTSGLKSHSNKNMDTAAAQAKKDAVVSPSKKDISSAPAKKDTAAALTKKDISSTSAKKDTSSASAKKDTPSTPAKKDTSSASAKKDISGAPAKKDTSSASAKKDTSSASAKKDTSSASAKKDTSSVSAKKDASSASAKKDASSASAKKDTSSASAKKDTSSSSAKKETFSAPAKKETSGASFKRDTSVGHKK